MAARIPAPRIPCLPAKIKKLGATKIARCLNPSMFVVGFKIVGDDSSAPGNGTAIVDALRLHFGDAARVTWDGRQAMAIVIELL